jgi:hypothetical protein
MPSLKVISLEMLDLATNSLAGTNTLAYHVVPSMINIEKYSSTKGSLLALTRATNTLAYLVEGI